MELPPPLPVGTDDAARWLRWAQRAILSLRQFSSPTIRVENRPDGVILHGQARGGSASAGPSLLMVETVQPGILICSPVTGIVAPTGSTANITVNTAIQLAVMMPPELQSIIYPSKADPLGNGTITYTYNYAYNSQSRTAAWGSGSAETEYITEPYIEGETVIWAFPCVGYVSTTIGDSTVTASYFDMNAGGRAWAT
jgi:hypothetical protein